NGISVKQFSQHALKNLHLGPQIPFTKERTAPRPLDVSHDSKRAAVRMAEESLWKLRNEWSAGDRLRLIGASVVREFVESGGPGCVASEVKRDQTEQPGGIRNIIGREVKVRADRLSDNVRTGPVTAQERALVAQLAWIGQIESDPVARGQEQGRGIRPAQNL